MERTATHLSARSAQCRPAPHVAPIRTPHDARVEERRAEAMRHLFPLHATGRAHEPQSAVARAVYAYLAEADSVEELERRLPVPRHYPREWIEEVRLRDGRAVVVRPILPGDAAKQRAFVRAMSPTTRLYRFHGTVSDVADPVLRYLTEIDYQDHFALVAEIAGDDDARQVAEARWVRRADARAHADFAIAIADDYQASGLGNALLDRLQWSATARGVARLYGHVLRTNRRMCGWLQERGWSLVDDPLDPHVVCAERPLAAQARPAAWREAA